MDQAMTWRQLTEEIAAVLGVELVWHEALDEYSRKDNGAAFDPVRVDAQAARLADLRGIRVKSRAGYTLAQYGVFSIAEYDKFNNGDPFKSFRLAICRAVLQQAATC